MNKSKYPAKRSFSSFFYYFDVVYFVNPETFLTFSCRLIAWDELWSRAHRANNGRIFNEKFEKKKLFLWIFLLRSFLGIFRCFSSSLLRVFYLVQPRQPIPHNGAQQLCRTFKGTLNANVAKRCEAGSCTGVFAKINFKAWQQLGIFFYRCSRRFKILSDKCAFSSSKLQNNKTKQQQTSKN